MGVFVGCRSGHHKSYHGLLTVELPVSGTVVQTRRSAKMMVLDSLHNFSIGYLMENQTDKYLLFCSRQLQVDVCC